MAIGKGLGKHIAVKAAAAVLGDLHILEEWGHIGHGVHENLEGFMEFIKFGAQSKGKGGKASPEEALTGLVMKHVSKIMSDLDDDTLAEGLGGDAGEEEEGQDKKAKVTTYDYERTASWGKLARPMLSPWGGEDHEWPAVSNVWDEEGVQRDRFNDVFVMRYVAYGLAGTPMLTVDTTPWVHHQKPEFAYAIQVFDEKAKSGKIPLEGYERSIPKLLEDALDFAKREVDGFVKQLGQFEVPHWDIEYDKRGDDLVVTYQAPDLSEFSDSSMSGSFYSPLNVFKGETSDYDLSYSEGADYEGHFGQRDLQGEVRSLEDIKKVLKDAERLWEKAEKQKADHS
jgi:hypothetical protein